LDGAKGLVMRTYLLIGAALHATISGAESGIEGTAGARTVVFVKADATEACHGCWLHYCAAFADTTTDVWAIIGAVTDGGKTCTDMSDEAA
jgi:hypothetical protein